jgi:hypothetical protein
MVLAEALNSPEIKGDHSSSSIDTLPKTDSLAYVDVKQQPLIMQET